MHSLVLLFIPVTTAIGWYAAKHHYSVVLETEEKKFTRSYLIGLNYLLNEQPDKAVDIFIKMLEVDSETVETHLALGTLFRRRGEVGRAIRIHQNLIARPQLPKQQRSEALLALAQDYLRAGLLDRAERLFLEAVEVGGESAPLALRHLIDIYQQEKRWEPAVTVAEKLINHGDKVEQRMAHYYCELADEAYKKNQFEPVQMYLQRALKVDPQCVRASMLQGVIAMQSGQFAAAIAAYQKITDQDVDYLTEVINPIINCYKQLNDEVGLTTFLQTSFTVCPRTSVVLAQADLLQQQGNEIAADYVADQLHKRPSLRGLQRLIMLQLHNAVGAAKENLLILQDLATKLLKNKPVYRCLQCGFGAKAMHWLCPSCKSWSTVKPIQGLEGE